MFAGLHGSACHLLASLDWRPFRRKGSSRVRASFCPGPRCELGTLPAWPCATRIPHLQMEHAHITAGL